MINIQTNSSSPNINLKLFILLHVYIKNKTNQIKDFNCMKKEKKMTKFKHCEMMLIMLFQLLLCHSFPI